MAVGRDCGGYPVEMVAWWFDSGRFGVSGQW